MRSMSEAYVKLTLNSANTSNIIQSGNRNIRQKSEFVYMEAKHCEAKETPNSVSNDVHSAQGSRLQQ